jgi:hypothetical protein
MRKFTALFLITCAAAFSPAANAQDVTDIRLAKIFSPSSAVVQFPELEVESTAEIGKTMVSKLNRFAHPAIEIAEDVSFDVKTGTFSNDWSGRTTIKKGLLKQYAETASGVYFVSDHATFRFSMGSVPQTAGIYVPRDSSRSPVPWSQSTASKRLSYGTSPVEFKATTIYNWTSDSFTRELIYSGVSQGTISLTYREFVDGTARPAFTQELKYDLSQGNEIGYKGARFKVIKAGNVEIKYVVTKNLD